jgi:hypothetical protein
MADRSSFWKMVDRTKPSKLQVFQESELRDCQDYFSEIQCDSTLPTNEIMTASERLILIRNEIDRRHNDAEHRQTQRLARWAIAAGVGSVAAAVISGVAQYLSNKSTRENWPVSVEAPTLVAPTPMILPTATPWVTAAPTVAAFSAPTPTATPKKQHHKTGRTRPRP